MKFKRSISLLLCLVMLLSLSTAFAADPAVAPGSGTGYGGGGSGSGSALNNGYFTDNDTTHGSGLFLSITWASELMPKYDVKNPSAGDEAFARLVRKCAYTFPDNYFSGGVMVLPQYAFSDSIEVVGYDGAKFVNTPVPASNCIQMQSASSQTNTLGKNAIAASGLNSGKNPTLPSDYWQKVIASHGADCKAIVSSLFSGGANGFTKPDAVDNMNNNVQAFLASTSPKEEVKNQEEFLNYCGLLATVAASLPDASERAAQGKNIDNMCSSYLAGGSFYPLLLSAEITSRSCWMDTTYNTWWLPRTALWATTGAQYNSSANANLNTAQSPVLQFLNNHGTAQFQDGGRIGYEIYGIGGQPTFTQYKSGGYTNSLYGTLLKSVDSSILQKYAITGSGTTGGTPIKPIEGVGYWGLSDSLVPKPTGEFDPSGTVGLLVQEKIYEKAKGDYTQTFNITVTANLDATGKSADGYPISSFSSNLTWLAMQQQAGVSVPDITVDIFLKQAKAIPALDGGTASALINNTYGYYGDGTTTWVNSDGVTCAPANSLEGGRFTWGNCSAALTLKDPGVEGVQVTTDSAQGSIRLTIPSGSLVDAASWFSKHSGVLTFVGECSGSGKLATDTSKNQHWFKVGCAVHTSGPSASGSGLQSWMGALRCEPEYDYATITAGPSEKPYYYSTYQQPFSEFKQGTVPTSGGGSSETFNSMTGTPTFTYADQRSDLDGTIYEDNGHYYQYFASGGSEFVVQFDGEYVESANASRTYKASFTPVKCSLDDTRKTCGCKHMIGDPPHACGGHCACDRHSPCQDHYVSDDFSWTQTVKGFSYVKIKNLKVWKLSEAKLDGTRELLNTDEVTATVQATAPTVFYNIAASNNSASGRLVYSYETAQNDTVTIPGYPQESNNDCSAHSTNNQKTLDGDTADETCSAVCVSDFIVLRTTNGDQSILYYEYKSKKEARINTGNCVAEPIEFEKVPYATIWTGNSQTSKGSGLPNDGITYGGYNGNYSNMSGKYQSTGHAQNISLEGTTAYKNASGRFKPTTKPTQKLRLLNDQLIIPDTKQNGEYILGNSKVFYENIINFGSGTANFPIVSQSDFGGRRGFVIQTTYSPGHDKINDVVVYNPVSNQNAMLISLPTTRDQRVKVSDTGAVAKTEVCPGDASCPYLKNQCTVTQHVHTEDCYTKTSYDVKPPYNAHVHTSACPYHMASGQWYHTSGCTYAGQTHTTTSTSYCTTCGNSCGYLLSTGGTKVYDCGNLPLNAYAHQHTSACFAPTTVSRTTGTEGKQHRVWSTTGGWETVLCPCTGIDCQYCKTNTVFSDNTTPDAYTKSAYYPIGQTNAQILSYRQSASGGQTPQAIMLAPGDYRVSFSGGHYTTGTSRAGYVSGSIHVPSGGLLSASWTGGYRSTGTLYLNDKLIATCTGSGRVTLDEASWATSSTGEGTSWCSLVVTTSASKTYISGVSLVCNNLPVNAPTGSVISTGSSGSTTISGDLIVGETKTYTAAATVSLAPGTYEITAIGGKGGCYRHYYGGGAGGLYSGSISLSSTTSLLLQPGSYGAGQAGGGYSRVLLASSGTVLLVGGGGGGYGYKNSFVHWGVDTYYPGHDAILKSQAYGSGGSRGGPSSGGAGGYCYISPLLTFLNSGHSTNTPSVSIKYTSAPTTTTTAPAAKVGDIVQTTGAAGYTMYKSVLSCNDPHHANSYNWKLYTYGLMHKDGTICTGRNCTDKTDLIFPTQEVYTQAQCAAGYIVKHANGDVHLSTTNNGTCSYCGNTYKTLLSAAQTTDRTPDPSEYTCYEYGDSRCWAPCGNPANHQKYVTDIVDNGVAYTMGKFINLDWPFQVYFPNTGDFCGTGAAWSSTTTAERGKGYTNNMDTTEWVKTKWIEFPFPVLYAGTTYKSYERIYLSVPQTVFDFYVPLQNSEAAQAEIKYGTVAINAQNGETLECGANRDHNIQAISYTGKPDAHHHNADKRSYIDVVGRIGALTLEDTGDFRFSNLFKQATSGWIVNNVVHKVDFTKPNYVFSDQVDVRGVSVTGTGTGGNTYGSKVERNDPSRLLTLPISPAKNNVTALQRQPLRLGYDCYFDLTTLGNYYGATLKDEGGNVTGQQLILVKPHYYRLDLESGYYKPVDVYMDVNGNKVLINDFDSNTVSYFGADANVSLNWRDEVARRNFSGYETNYTNNVKSSYSWVETPYGSSWTYGNYNILNLTQRNRTFIGSEFTYGWDKDPSDKLPNVGASLQGARWHFNVGLPSSACFVYSGQEASDANIDACASGSCAVFCALEIYAQGDLWTLGYDGSNVNKPFRIVAGGPQYDPVIPYPTDRSPKGEEQPIVAVFSINKSSKGDLNVTGTH